MEYAYLSSSTVKEYAKYGVDVSRFVPANVIPMLEKKLMIH
jgi:pantetheine-phosphate adenylyltransferase